MKTGADVRSAVRGMFRFSCRQNYETVRKIDVARRPPRVRHALHHGVRVARRGRVRLVAFGRDRCGSRFDEPCRVGRLRPSRYDLSAVPLHCRGQLSLLGRQAACGRNVRRAHLCQDRPPGTDARRAGHGLQRTVQARFRESADRERTGTHRTGVEHRRGAVSQFRREDPCGDRRRGAGRLRSAFGAGRGARRRRRRAADLRGESGRLYRPAVPARKADIRVVRSRRAAQHGARRGDSHAGHVYGRIRKAQRYSGRPQDALDGRGGRGAAGGGAGLQRGAAREQETVVEHLRMRRGSLLAGDVRPVLLPDRRAGLAPLDALFPRRRAQFDYDLSGPAYRGLRTYIRLLPRRHRVEMP